MKKIIRNILLIVCVFLLFGYLLSTYGSTKQPNMVGLDQLVKQINNGEISTVEVQHGQFLVTLKNNQTEAVQRDGSQSLTEVLKDFNVASDKMLNVGIKVADQSQSDLWANTILPIAIPAILIGLFFWFMMRGMAGANNRAMSFGQSPARENAKDDKNKVVFADVAGVKEAKAELEEVVDFLKDAKKFTEVGARIPRGVLLLGNPGTGKTLLAKAVAGEAGVPFFSMSGSEFVEMFVGVGASRVRDLFHKAKKNVPCIVFIDEIDAVGRKRGSSMGGSHDEREQTLNQILVEMDGFEPNLGVIVIAATNRPDVLDPALLRPGRFDRQVVLDLPDLADREAILKIHAMKKPLAKDVALRKVAERTPGFSGADLANVLNEAALLTARHNKKAISQEAILESIEKVMMGPERKSRVISQKEKEITAYHEAGHAVVAHFLPLPDPVHKVSIIARGSAGGYTLKLPSEDRHMHTKQEFIEEIAVMLGGYLTEKAIYGEVTTGATSDLRRATNLARHLITDYGMSDHLGPRTFGDKEEMIFLGREIHEQRDYSEQMAQKIDEEIAGFIAQGQTLAERIIKTNRDDIELVTKELLEKETLEQKEFLALVSGANS